MPRIPLDPNLVFIIFLPPLLYSAAWTVSWRDFRRNLLIIGLLAVGLVGFTVWGVAEFSDRFISALDWKAGFLLGAVLATTDAIAATSVAKSLGLPRRIVDILEGESLLNDATGLLALEMGIGLLQSGDLPTVQAGLAKLVYLIVGGLGIGLLMGLLVVWFERFVDNGPIELVLSLIMPYAAYLAGEEAKASGVLAVVACGLYVSRQSPKMFSPSVRIQVVGAWQALTFALNGIVFLLIGLQMPYVLAGIKGGYHMVTLVGYGLIFSVTLIILRMVWIAPSVWLTNLVHRMKGHPDDINQRETFVIGWTGMRGVIALAAAVSVPEVINGQEFGARNLIVFLTFSVILVTLVLQGLTLPSLIRALGLAGESGMEPEEREARLMALKEAVGYLEEGRRGKGEAYFHAYDDLIDRYEHRLAGLQEEDSEQGATKAQVYQELVHAARGALEAERRTIIRLRDEGAISDDVLRKMERILDLEESKYQIS
ncbi:MAG: Na+/H+ antiporter [Edaphobacter sp.]|uniref:Na+/H+ antiporter n=1 Tax=Edaphobacter sp. TaxID=1934404 RepID=UPI002390A1E5|nr:Na+/H+ antiporter [Edaphobacter sp.]MDE1176211.1 Na+/H+ antiporter [Edaphobacter sp.]